MNESENSKQERSLVRTKDVINDDTILFHQLKLSTKVLNGLSFNNFKYPSPIQVKAIPMGMLGFDLIIQAKSGTGKTCVFAVLALERINVDNFLTQVIVISPTREIALQSKNVICDIGSYIDKLNCHLFIGGIKVNEDLKNIKNCHIVVGTPGRIKYLIEENHLQTDHVRMLVLDEADMLFTENFHNSINFIYNCLPQHKQMITLSATYTEQMTETISQLMNSPAMLRLSYNDRAALIGVQHYVRKIETSASTESTNTFHQIFWAKTEALMDILGGVNFQQCIVFSNHHSVAQDLCDALRSQGWATDYISSSLDQAQRIETYNKLKNFHCQVLITTDLSSRGIDAENVNLVINLEVPWENETYLHRMGRAGRFGSYGAVINLVTAEEWINLQLIRDNCNLTLQMLPAKLPFDLLDVRLDPSCTDQVEVEIFERGDDTGPKDMLQFLQQFSKESHKNIQSQRDVRVTTTELQKSNKTTDMCYSYFHSALQQFSEDKLVAMATIAYSNRAQATREEQLALLHSTRGQPRELVIGDEVDHAELTRLASWADYYHQQYSAFTSSIEFKNRQLNALLDSLAL